MPAAVLSGKGSAVAVLAATQPEHLGTQSRALQGNSQYLPGNKLCYLEPLQAFSMLELFLCFLHPSGHFRQTNSLEPGLPSLLDPGKPDQLRTGICWAILRFVFFLTSKDFHFSLNHGRAHIRKRALARLKSPHRALFKFVGLFNVHHTLDSNSATDFLSGLFFFFSTATRRSAPPNISTACYFEAVRQNTQHIDHIWLA